MARPIEATPKLNKKDSERLLKSLQENSCSREEAARRKNWAEEQLAFVMKSSSNRKNETRR